MKSVESVIGIGVDLVETARMEDSLSKWGERFTQKVFGDNERAYCDGCAEPARHYAGRFAVKEAVSKAFGTGIGKQLGWLDIEVVRGESSGAPTVQLSPRAQAWSEQQGVRRILVSLSHTHNYAVAQAVLIGCTGNEST